MVAKYTVLAVDSRFDTITQRDFNFILRGQAPLQLKTDVNEFILPTNDSVRVWFEINATFAINWSQLLKGKYYQTTPEGTVMVEGYYEGNGTWSWEYQQNVSSTDHLCIEQAIVFQTKAWSWQASTADDYFDITRTYAFRSSGGNVTNTGYYDEFVRYCLVESKITASPTPAPIVTQPPTQPPTATPTNPNPHPEFLDCIFEDNGAAILVVFDKQTNRARLGGEPFSCLKVFTPPSYDELEGVALCAVFFMLGCFFMCFFMFACVFFECVFICVLGL